MSKQFSIIVECDTAADLVEALEFAGGFLDASNLSDQIEQLKVGDAYLFDARPGGVDVIEIVRDN